MNEAAGSPRHMSCSLQDCLSSAENGTEGNPKAESISREILTYLGHLPYRFHKDDLKTADLALSLGNCLIWIHHWLEPHKPEIESPLGETPQSLFSLGKQFRAVALLKFEAEKAAGNITREQYTGILKLLKSQSDRFDSLEKALQNLTNPARQNPFICACCGKIQGGGK